MTTEKDRIKNCIRCSKSVSRQNKSMCHACYKSVYLGIPSYQDRLKERNFVFGDVGILTTNQGREYIIDLIDFEFCKNHLWNEDTKLYARTDIDNKPLKLHKYIMPDDGIVDYIYGNKFDCRRKNLRYVTPSDSSRNVERERKNKSGVYGVYACGKRWVTRMHVNKKNIHIGIFDTKEQAKEAWTNFAIKHNLLQYYRNAV